MKKKPNFNQIRCCYKKIKNEMTYCTAVLDVVDCRTCYLISRDFWHGFFKGIRL